ncbi:aBC transporter ATP-binding protein [Clostridium sp. CAG:1000]|nr:aBC transporter ATP-binding protein [Clostridium sp. CAG:1000]
MIEISLNKINKSYGFNNVLNNLSFDVKTNERVALIGSNGCGKTTTLKIIMGIESYDSGNISIRKESKIGYLTQMPPKEDDNVSAKSVYLRGVQELIDLENKINDFVENMSSNEKDIKLLDKLQEEFRISGGYSLKEKIEKIRNGFKITNELLDREYNKLSGGEKTLINLASIILSNPDILLLDEPTNHLDIDTLEWFEEYLSSYNGTVVIISHDRYFLDRTVNKIIEIENGNANIYHGNYSYYLKESEKRLMVEFQNYKNQQKEIKALKEAIERYKVWGAKSDNPMFFRRAKAIETRLEKMEVIEKPKTKSELRINLNVEDRTSNRVMVISNFDLKIGNKELLRNSHMEVYYKERVCLMGKNGAGKTTLIKNILSNTHDNIKLGTNIKIGYIPQEIRFDNEDLTIYEHMRKIFVGSESELRSKLNQFYFTADNIDKKVKNLSGGEKVRLKLLELILKNANFLILDEPTNHIDIDTREILEESLLAYDGTILFISHDRYFINKIATKIVMIENKEMITYNGNYDSIKKKSNDVLIKEVAKPQIIIKGSNRLNEFLKTATSIEKITIGCSGKKVYKIRKKSKVFYLKVANHLSKESISLDYLKDKVIVPEKVFYEKYNGMSYLLTKSLNGIMLCDDYFDDHVMEGIDIIVEAFNALYNIDYSDCVIDETIPVKIKRIEENIGLIKEEDIKKEILDRFHTKQAILKYLKGNMPKQIIGFTHGDMSLPNIYACNGHFSGLLDTEDAGLSDIYYDLVVCEMSIERNYGKEYVDVFYEKLGIEKDEFKSDYYRILLSL